MPEHSVNIGPFVLDHRINTSEDRALFFAPRASGTRIPFDAAVYCLNHTHREAQHQFALKDDFLRLKSFHHPMFPKTIQLYERQFGYAREWIDGASLREMLVMIHQSKTLLPQDTIYDIIAEILQGYAFLQQQTPALLHGRINWDHILLGVDGRISMIGWRTHSNKNLFSFSSPEQATGTFLDWRSDQWSIGAIFASLLLKESLYTGRPNPEYAASRGDVTHWLDRIKVAYPAAYRVVSKMIHPAAGERYDHYSYIIRDVNKLRELYPNSKRIELGRALKEWMADGPQQVSQNLDILLPNRILPQAEPSLQQHVLEVTEQLEPEIESYIEVTQFNTPKFKRNSDIGDLNTKPEPQLASSSLAPSKTSEPDGHLDITEISVEQNVPIPEPAVLPSSSPKLLDSAPNNLATTDVTAEKKDHQKSPLKDMASVNNPPSSLDAYSLAEASLIGETFQAQQRAVVLMIINGLFLLSLIWKVLF